MVAASINADPWALPEAQAPELRPYQADLINRAHAALRTHRRVLIESPTGSGKRYLIVWWAAAIAGLGKYVLILTDRRLIVNQTADELDRFGLDYGLIMAGCRQDRTANVQVASLQTLLSPKRLYKEGVGLPIADWVIIDEAHKSPNAYTKILKHYPNAKIAALTASPVGNQGTALVPGYFDTLVTGPPVPQLIAGGYLLPVKVRSTSEPGIKGVQLNYSTGEYNQTQLARAVRQCTTHANVFQEWHPYRHRETILFAPGIPFGQYLTDETNKRYGEGTAELVVGATSYHDRQDMFARFNSGALKMLVSVDVLREGFDAYASCGIDLQPSKQLRSYVQKVGRIRRPRGAHDHAVWIDMAGNYWRHPHPDEPIDWNEVTATTSTEDLVKEWRKDKPEREGYCCPKCKAAWRSFDLRCPECGHQRQPAKRYIRMENGRLREMPVRQKQIKTAREQHAAQWKSELYAGMRAYKGNGRSLEQCRAMFFRRHKKNPPHDLPCMPPIGDPRWQLNIHRLYKKRDIEHNFKKEGK